MVFADKVAQTVSMVSRFVMAGRQNLQDLSPPSEIIITSSGTLMFLSCNAYRTPAPIVVRAAIIPSTSGISCKIRSQRGAPASISTGMFSYTNPFTSGWFCSPASKPRRIIWALRRFLSRRSTKLRHPRSTRRLTLFSKPVRSSVPTV